MITPRPSAAPEWLSGTAAQGSLYGKNTVSHPDCAAGKNYLLPAGGTGAERYCGTRPARGPVRVCRGGGRFCPGAGAVCRLYVVAPAQTLIAVSGMDYGGPVISVYVVRYAPERTGRALDLFCPGLYLFFVSLPRCQYLYRAVQHCAGTHGADPV